MLNFLKKIFSNSNNKPTKNSGLEQPVPNESESFPFVIGRISLSESSKWSINLPLMYKQRFEGKQRVFFRPGFTIYLTIWDNENSKSKEERLNTIIAGRPKTSYDETQTEDEKYLKFSYRVNEPSEDDRVDAFYSLVFSDYGHVQLSMYFDQESDIQLAHDFLESVNDEPASVKDISIYSQACLATKAVLGVDSNDGLGIMYRDNPGMEDDSGWQFYTGREGDEYVNDSKNISLYPVAVIAEKYPEIIPHLDEVIGTEFMREDGELMKTI
ncbi:MAG: DUF2185 domain-containing protein [Saccharospirillaceae bacterium]|nr:DUF2185 domain-containing protein [Pseudomonadales bacterium]NRB79966.1 DUF2185 domain-containing protein [Saccharospirillaceae bacterium]